MKHYRILFVLFILMMTTGCTSTKITSAIEITEAWVRAVDSEMSMVGNSATALFMTIQNNTSTADVLIKAESDIAEMVQIHLSEIDANGVASMHEVAGVEIPANGIAELKPGSYHVMVMGLKREIKEGDMVTFTLVFQNAGNFTIEAPVKVP
ncbi:MAG: copper chaperone PCu(A)C [Anaerolineales bacterium]|nr:copper chaperone PCu(A)C [Anaerolineales bacterium]